LKNTDLVSWVDPGLTSGIAVWSFAHGNVIEVKEFDFEELGCYLDNMPVQRIGWETFKITERTAKLTQAPWSLEVIGMCRWLALQKNWDVLKPAMPADRAPIHQVDALGWCPRGMRDDGMSACQHLLAWLLRTRLAPRWIYDTISPGT